MKRLFLKINTTTGSISTLAGASVGRLVVTNLDTVLFACHFFEIGENGKEARINLYSGGSEQLHCTIKALRQHGATVYASQGTVNQGDSPANEDRTTGRVTWRLNVTSAALTAALVAAPAGFMAWLEFAFENGGNNQRYTLAQQEISIYPSLDYSP